MQKPLVILLIAANLVLWGWRTAFHRAPAPPEQPAVTLPASDPGIPAIETVNIPAPAGCYLFGPLNTPLEQHRAAERLRSFAATVWMRESETLAERGWWVYLPAAPSREAALGEMEKLAAAGIDDYFLVAEGDDQNTVSLGLFSNPDNARLRMRQLQARGFDARAGVRRERQPRYWVDYRLHPARRDLSEMVLRAFPKAERRPMPCPGE